MNGLDLNKITEAATQYNESTFLFVIFMLFSFVLVGSFLTTYWMKISLPESKKRMSLMDKATEAIDTFAITQTHTNTGILELKQSHSTLASQLEQQGEEGKRVIRCARVACELVEKKDFANAHQYATRMRDILDA